MLDIHCHILPGLDDGAPNYANSLLMAKQAEAEGIHTIIATPHHQNGTYINDKEDILSRIEELNNYLQVENSKVRILPGQEIRIYEKFLNDYENGEIMTLANHSSYVLIELPSSHVPAYTNQLFFDIQMKGLTPVISNPERNHEIIDQPDLLYSLVKNGAATQISTGSLSGQFGKKIQKFAFDLIDANLAHFVASNAHNAKKRSFRMLEAFDLIEKKYGTDHIYYFQNNSEIMAKGNHIYRDIPKRTKKKKIMGLF
ncbi:tyrosine-protein phosphatase [Lederbergia wuyishanensis]|uniref:Tyrosine-protein phosphatase n=1 Tax=Lederbergia wuyishanensis TaxID=1347903 RepID=A0ABU0D9N2_9BACI|nr:CpsB/CapC family capsule biosynthesis tyrosine phosphatase [Lederbergia wuyishanensis]MCJ8007466.1 tyrosine protein phosphatase [Lederbergia wuyishanensis]MDQ0345095.1 protein-tyrosine phosphatase [Lederbergia wuyishanensis]